MLIDGALPTNLWADLVQTAIYLINRLPLAPTKPHTPFQHLYKLKPQYSHLRSIGCACFPLTPPSTCTKLDPKTLNCVLIGYSDASKGYRCFNPSTGKFILSRNLLFDEATFPLKQLSSTPTSVSTSFTSNSPLLYLPSSFTSPPTHTTTSQFITPHTTTSQFTTPSSEFIHPPPSSQPTQQLVPSTRTAAFTSLHRLLSPASRRALFVPSTSLIFSTIPTPPPNLPHSLKLISNPNGARQCSKNFKHFISKVPGFSPLRHYMPTY